MWTLWNKIYLVKTVFENFMKWGLKGGFQLIQILYLLGMYFDAVVVRTFLLLFRLAMTTHSGRNRVHGVITHRSWHSGCHTVVVTKWSWHSGTVVNYTVIITKWTSHSGWNTVVTKRSSGHHTVLVRKISNFHKSLRFVIYCAVYGLKDFSVLFFVWKFCYKIIS